jgi:hypothetical protein
VLALVNKQQGGAFAFFAENFCVWGVFARGYAPIDTAYVVAGLILAHFGKIYATALLFAQAQTSLSTCDIARA